jgi:hypothetical protein
MKKELVIAAYDKDLDWLVNVPSDIKVTVYTKGKNYGLPNEVNIIPNVGRCVHSFFKFIVNNYNNLSHITYFAQEQPFDHWSNLIECLSMNEEQLQKTATIYHEGYFGYNTLHHTIPSLYVGTGGVLICDKTGYLNHPNLPLIHIWPKLFTCKMPSVIEFNPGGHFAITNTHIHKRSLNFYKKIVSLLEDGITEDDRITEIPFCIERFENYIFNSKYITSL